MMSIPVWLQFVIIGVLVVLAVIYFRKWLGKGGSCEGCALKDSCNKQRRRGKAGKGGC